MASTKMNMHDTVECIEILRTAFWIPMSRTETFPDLTLTHEKNIPLQLAPESPLPKISSNILPPNVVKYANIKGLHLMYVL